MVGRIPSRGSDQFVVRMPDGMRNRLREAADANGRSMNAEIIARLEGSFPDPDADKKFEKFVLEQREEALVFNMNSIMEQLSHIQTELAEIRRQRSDSTPSGS